jgi:hypothetical protein
MPNAEFLISWGRDLLPHRGEFQGCQLTADPGRLAEAHVVIFHVPTIPPLRHIPKHLGQIWVALSMESELNINRGIRPGLSRRSEYRRLCAR